MRAMVLEKPRPAEESPLAQREIPTQSPGVHELRVRVHCCGVCHTDLHTVEGDLPLPKLPVMPGHQIVGVVDAIGSGVRQFKEGDRVGITWLYSTDGMRKYCIEAHDSLADTTRFPRSHV